MIKQHMAFVEDDASVRTKVGQLLREHFPEFEVDTIDSFGEAKKLLRQRFRDGYITRVLIVDEELKSDGRGSDLLALIHKTYPNVRKIILASQARPEDLSKAINKGHVDRYILKRHFDRRHALLFDAIRESLADRGTVYEAMAEVLQRAERIPGPERSVLIAGKKPMSPGELLQHLTMGTKLGREHMKQFTELLYSAFQQPELFLKQMTRLAEARRKRKRRRSTKPRSPKTSRP